MEIRHDDAYWNEKYEDLLKIAGAFRDERNLLRSQLSEALGKIREYREWVHIPDIDPQPIPHHGPGLSEAEDAMRDGVYISCPVEGKLLDIEPESGVCAPKTQSLRLIIERDKDGQLHFFVQDINTWWVRHRGVRTSESDVWLAIDPEDRACIEQVCHKQGDV